MKIHGILFVGFVLITQAEAGPTKFDLHCKGTFASLAMTKTNDWPWKVRIDLDRMQWCSVDCKNVWDIYGATNTVITLEDDRSPVEQTLVTVNRMTGVVKWRTRAEFEGIKLGQNGDAVCTPAPFSGFPTSKF